MENQLCDILRNMNASANFGRGLGVSFPIFDGSENLVCSMFESQFSICFILRQCCVTQPSSLNQQRNCAFIGHDKPDFSFVTFINLSDNEFSK